MNETLGNIRLGIMGALTSKPYMYQYRSWEMYRSSFYLFYIILEVTKISIQKQGK